MTLQSQPVNERSLSNSLEIVETGEATGYVPINSDISPIQVFGTQSIRETMGASCIQQAIGARKAPGVSGLFLNPDAHYGHGVPVGSVLTSPTHIYPGPVGVDIKCSMSLLQLDAPEDAIRELHVRREIIREIESRLAHGRHGPRHRGVTDEVGFDVAVYGGTKKVLAKLGIPSEWAERCEDHQHTDPGGDQEGLALRLQKLLREKKILDFNAKAKQLGSYGGGNHFGECEIVRVCDDPESKSLADSFGLQDGCVGFLSHCGSRGLGHALAMHQFSHVQQSFRRRGCPFPNGDKELIYLEHGSPDANHYLCDMALGANFATVNHLLINAIVLEAFRKVLPGVQGRLIYYISHNLARQEWLDGQLQWIHRKGATRAYPAGHAALEGTPFATTGHPILLPGNPRDGSSIMVAKPGAAMAAFSINHGAGRRLSRTAAKAQLNATAVSQSLRDADVVSNCRHYPVDDAPEAYKDFREVLRSVKLAGLAHEVATLQAKFVIKDASR